MMFFNIIIVFINIFILTVSYFILRKKFDSRYLNKAVLDNTKKELVDMAYIAKENLNLSIEMLFDKSYCGFSIVCVIHFLFSVLRTGF